MQSQCTTTTTTTMDEIEPNEKSKRADAEKKTNAAEKFTINLRPTSSIDGGGDPFCIILIIYWRRSPCYASIVRVPATKYETRRICGCAWQRPAIERINEWLNAQKLRDETDASQAPNGWLWIIWFRSAVVVIAAFVQLVFSLFIYVLMKRASFVFYFSMRFSGNWRGSRTATETPKCASRKLSAPKNSCRCINAKVKTKYKRI